MCFGFLKSSLGKKVVMAVTGVILFGFVIMHMLGNLQVFLGQDALNNYALKLQKMPYLLWPARAFLLTALITHIVVAVWLTAENRRARPVAYTVKETVQASYASRTMMMSGVIVFVFIVYHLLHFTFGVTHPELFHRLDARGRYDVYTLVVSSYHNVWVASAYVLAMVPLCLHLSHGLSSLFQSLGLKHTRFQPALGWFAKGMALIIFIGNSSIPMAAFFNWLKLPAR